MRVEDQGSAVGAWGDLGTLPPSTVVLNATFGASSLDARQPSPSEDNNGAPGVTLEHATLWYAEGLVRARAPGTQREVHVRPPHSVADPVALLLSGGELWAVNRSCVAGLFTGLSGCVPHWNVPSPAFAAATHTELFLMDSATGNVAGLPHATSMHPDLAVFLTRIARPWTADTERPAIQPNVLLPPRLAAQPLTGFGAARKVEVRGGLARTFATARVERVITSALPPVTSERAYAHWSAGAECETPEACPFAFYREGSGACELPRNMCARGTRNVDNADTRCAAPPPAAASCLSGYQTTEACGEGFVQYFVGCRGDYKGAPRCVPRPACADYNAGSNQCSAPLAARRTAQTRARRNVPPTCAAPSPSPVVGPTAPPVSPVCEDSEFLDGDVCTTCSLCPAGTRLESSCNPAQTVCVDCGPGEYMDLPWHNIDHCKLQRYPHCPGASRVSDGTCPSLRWFAEHWYYILYFATILYAIWAVRFK